MADDDSLSTYRSKRDFRRTTEPLGEGHRRHSKLGKGDHPIFVIQQHDASTMHWDLRIEVDGVLKSWALPKGPSTDLEEKRLAVATEDHPLDYADFEGVIPEEEYGGGSVIVWDAGPYESLSKDDEDRPLGVGEALGQGKAEVWLEGKKIRGGYALIHAKVGGDDDSWLLVKMRDEGADARRNPVSTEPRSVLSGRTIEEVGDDEVGDDEVGEDDP